MKFTVAICTWNRAQMLRQTLESFSHIDQSQFQWELLVVNNNCTDDTVAVCQAFGGRLPLRMVLEPQQGHSHSRNRAVLEARGEFILWTDDDVLVDGEILTAYAAAAEKYPQAAFFGGKIIPKFAIKPPRWISENWEICAGVFAARDLAESQCECDRDRLPFGANLVVRRAIQQQFLFDPDFGRNASTVRGFDEIDVLNRMLEAGHRGYWIPEARVEHLIPESRKTLEYFKSYFYGQGQTWIKRGVVQPTKRQLQQQITRNRLLLAIKRLGTSKDWLPIFVALHNLRGQLHELKTRG